jgi:hypothetical protein
MNCLNLPTWALAAYFVLSTEHRYLVTCLDQGISHIGDVGAGPTHDRRVEGSEDQHIHLCPSIGPGTIAGSSHRAKQLRPGV